GAAAGIRHAAAHPLFQRGDVALRQLSFRRHLQVFVLIAHRPQEQTLLRLTDNDRGPGVAAAQQGVATVEKQTAALLRGLRGMTFEAAFDEEWTDALLEKLAVGGSERSVVRPRDGCAGCENDNRDEMLHPDSLGRDGRQSWCTYQRNR